MRKIIMFRILFMAFLFLSTQIVGDQNLNILNQLIEFDWKKPGTYFLKNSQSTLELPKGHYALLDQNAVHFLKLNGNLEEDNTIEAITINEHFHPICFSYFDVGYVCTEDWDQVDPQSYLETIIKSTSLDNQKRSEQGYSELKVLGWFVAPIFDKTTHTLLWAIEIESEGKQIINAVALKLGRYGFERIVSIIEKNADPHFDSELDLLLKAFSFKEGHQYSDFNENDKKADFTISKMFKS